MSEADIERLIAERSLTRHVFDDAQVAAYWSKALAAFTNAHAPGVNSDGAFQLAYTAGLQATIALLAAHGLRVKSTASHYKAFLALQKLEGGLREHGVRFDKMRIIRHASIYEPEEDEAEMAERVKEALHVLAGAFPEMRAAIIAAQPSVAHSLAAFSR